MVDVSFDVQAFSKVVLHVTKYPAYSVNGVLLSKRYQRSENTFEAAGGDDATDKSNTIGKSVTFHDCIPLLHMSKYVTPSMEVALAQVEQHCRKTNQEITGYYQANQNLNDSEPDFVAARVAEKLSELNPHILVLMVNNDQLDSNLESIPFTIYQLSDGKLKEKDINVKLLPDEQGSLSTVSALIQAKAYRNLIDFDNHMDDIRLDYWINNEVNEQIQQLM